MSIKKHLKRILKNLRLEVEDMIDAERADAYENGRDDGFGAGYNQRKEDEQAEAVEKQQAHEDALAEAYSRGYEDGWAQCQADPFD